MESDSLEHSRETKQNYLREKIIDGGYDASVFQEYLNSLKNEGGTNIDIWSLEELIQVVDDFKKEMEKAGIKPEHEEHLGEEAKISTDPEEKKENPNKTEGDAVKKEGGEGQPEEKQIETKENKKNTVFDDFITLTKEEIAESDVNVKRQTATSQPNRNTQNVSDDDNFYKTMQCRDINPKGLSQEVYIRVQDPHIVKEGIFSSSYLSVEVVTQPLNCRVRRKFADFVWLRNLLRNSYPNLIIPSLPKERGKNRFDDISNAKRVYLLERFLNDCLEYDEVKADPYIIDFLASDEKSRKWSQTKKFGEKIQKPQSVSEFTKPTGTAVLQINSELRDYARSAAGLVHRSEPIYKKMRELSKQLTAEFRTLSDTILELGNCFHLLYKAAVYFDNETALGQNTKLDNVYLTMNKMMSTWAEQMRSQSNIVQDSLCDFFKYSHLQHDSIREILKGRVEAANEFVKCKKINDAKKERHFMDKDIHRWEIPPKVLKDIDRETLLTHKPLAFELMFPKDTAIENQLKNRFAFLNFEAFNKINKTLVRKCQFYVSNFQKFAKAQTESLSMIHIRWADVLAHFADTTEKKVVKLPEKPA